MEPSAVKHIKAYIAEHIHEPISAADIAPRMQLAPQGWRGYIEMRPVSEAM